MTDEPTIELRRAKIDGTWSLFYSFVGFPVPVASLKLVESTGRRRFRVGFGYCSDTVMGQCRWIHTGFDAVGEAQFLTNAISDPSIFAKTMDGQEPCELILYKVKSLAG